MGRASPLWAPGKRGRVVGERTGGGWLAREPAQPPGALVPTLTA